MSWWNPFGWSGSFAEDRPEGIWGGPPAGFRPASVLGEGSIVEATPIATDAGVSSSVLGEVANDFGTAGAGFSQGGFGASGGGIYDSGARSLSSLQPAARPEAAPADLIDGMGVGFAA